MPNRSKKICTGEFTLPRLRSLVLILLVLLLFPSISHATSKLHTIKLQLKWKHQFQFAGYYIAKEKGFYKDERLDVTILPHDPNRSPAKALLSGDVDYAVTGSDIVVHRANGEPLVALATIFQHSAYGFLVRSDSGIKKIEDFRGRKVMLGTGIQDTALRAALKRAGLNETDYIQQPSSQDINSLVSGETDVFNAYITDQKFHLDELGIEGQYILPIKYGVDFYGDVLATTEQEVINHNDRLQAFLRASLKGWQYALEHQDEAIDLILEKYNTQRMSYQHLEYEAHATRELIQPMLVALGHMDPARWESIKQTLVETGLIENDKSIKGLIYSHIPQDNKVFSWLQEHGTNLALWSLTIYIIALLLVLLRVLRKYRKSTLKLATSEQCLRDSQAHAKIGHWEHYNGDNKEIWSEQIYKIFGLDSTVNSCHESLRNLMRNDEFEALTESLINSRDNWTEHHAEYRIKHPDGTERWIECRGVPSFDENGNRLKISGFIQDITYRKQIEEEIRTERDFAENLINMAQAIVLVLDPKGRIVRFNPYMETISGYKLSEVKNKEWFSTFLPEEEQDKVRSVFLAAINDIQTSGNINAIITKHGERREIEWYNKTFKDAEDNTLGILCIGHDITERIRAEQEQKRLQKELQQAQKMEAMGQLTGGVAHDFNNLLGIIIGNLDALHSEVMGKIPAIRHSESALKAAYRGSELTKRRLSFSGNTTTNTSPHNINHIITGLLTILERSITSSIQVETMFSAGLWDTNINSGDLEDTLINLAANARDAMPNGGLLKITTRNTTIDGEEAAKLKDVETGDYVELSIADTGKGISQKVIDRIFEPFFTTKEIGKGTGLGLSIVYRFIESVDGHIEITSKLGKGTNVRILLPRSDITLKESKKPETELTQSTIVSGTILVVDDEKDLVMSTKSLLNQAGYQTITAFNGNQALIALKNNPNINLMFTDVVMSGGMSGFELAREAQHIYPNLKIVIASGYSSRFNQEDIIEFKDIMLHKPYRTEEMLEFIKKHLETK